MKRIYLLLLSLVFSGSIISQEVQGIIYYQNSGGKPAGGIQVSAFGCGSVYSVSNGTFVLPCPQKSVGQNIRLLLGSTDGKGKSIEIVNQREVDLLTIPKDAPGSPIEIIVSYAGDRDRAALKYYGILTKPTYQIFADKLAAVEAQLEKNTLEERERKTLLAQIEELKAERNAAFAKLEEQAQLLANINQDRATEAVKLAFRQIEQGQEIQQALATIFDPSQLPDARNLPKTIRANFAQAFNRPEELIELNLPPSGGRYPGSVLLSPAQGQVLPMRRVFRPEDLPRTKSDVSITLSGQTQSELVSQLLGNSRASAGVDIQIDLKDLRLFEMDLSSNFKRSLLRDKSIYRAEKRGQKPRAIVRAYEALLTYTLRKNDAYSQDSWNSIQKDALAIGGRLTNEGGITIQSNQPSVIAYESVSVNYIVNNLNVGDPDEVILRDHIVEANNRTTLSLKNLNLQPANKAITYLAWGNTQYESEYFGNLNVVGSSIELFSGVMEQSGGRPLLEGANPESLTSAQMDEILDRAAAALKKQKRKTPFIFYYVGHAVAGPNGHQYLVLKDYRGNPAEDIGENYLYGLSREQLEAPASPVSGSNFSDLFDVANALKTAYPEEIEGLYPVSEIERRLGEAGVPMVVLVDACFSVEQMEQLRMALSLTPDGDYYGPSNFGGPDEVLRYAKAIKRFGNVPYLNSQNPVILSAAPGSIAVVVPDPLPGLLKSNRVAPLARKIYTQFENTLVEGTAISLGDFFYSIVDIKELGEVRIRGSVSWSDFSKVNKVGFLEEYKRR